MASRLSEWGNALYSGEKSYQIVQRRRMWLTISTSLLVLSLLIIVFKGLNPGIDFRGGTEFTVGNVENVSTEIAAETVLAAYPDEDPRVTVINGNSIRVQIGQIDQTEIKGLAEDLAEAYGVPDEDVASTFIGPTWGADVSKKAIQGVVWFLALVALLIGFYFRAWHMAVAAIVALLHDLVFTMGIYALVGFEVTPSTVIGFLTILGFSLYDTVVVFDKVRENTAHLTGQKRYTYAELSNLAVNQTLVRSINTTIVGLLPVAAILFIGAFLMGAGTLKDIALSLFVGMAVGAYSSIFVASPLEVVLRRKDAKVAAHTKQVLEARESGTADVAVTEDGRVRVGAVTPGGHLGTAAQPKRKRRK